MGRCLLWVMFSGRKTGCPEWIALRMSKFQFPLASQCMVDREETFTHSITRRVVAAVTTQSREDT